MLAAAGLEPARLFAAAAGVAIVCAGLLVAFRPVLGVYLLAFLIPLENFQVIPGIDLTVSKLLGAYLGLVCLAHLVAGGLPGVRRTAIDIPLAIFFLACALSLAKAQYPREAVGHLASLVSYALLFYLASTLLRDERQIRRALWCLWSSCLLAAMIFLLQSHGIPVGGSLYARVTYIGDQLMTRNTGTSGNTAVFLTFPILGIAASLCLLRGSNRHLPRIALIGAITISVWAIYLSYTRSGLLAMAAMFGCYGVLFARNKLGAKLLLAVAALGVLLYLPGYVLDHFSAALTLDDPSAESRIVQLIAAKNLLQQDFLVGIGIGNTDLRVVGSQLGFDVLQNTIHCTPVVMFVETGLIGGTAFLALCGVLAISSYRAFLRAEQGSAVRGLAPFGLLALVGHFTHLVFHPVVYNAVIGVVYGTAAAAICLVNAEKRGPDGPASSPDGITGD